MITWRARVTTVRFRPTTVHAGQTRISPEHAGALRFPWRPDMLMSSADTVPPVTLRS